MQIQIGWGKYQLVRKYNDYVYLVKDEKGQLFLAYYYLLTYWDGNSRSDCGIMIPVTEAESDSVAQILMKAKNIP